jgi:hypothetical protein
MPGETSPGLCFVASAFGRYASFGSSPGGAISTNPAVEPVAGVFDVRGAATRRQLRSAGVAL